MTALLVGGVTTGQEWVSSAIREMARAESWVALCAAAGEAAPTDVEWRRLGIQPAPTLQDEAEYACGAWRTLAWLLGVRADLAMYTSCRRAAGIPPEQLHLHAPLRAGEPSPAWSVATPPPP